MAALTSKQTFMENCLTRLFKKLNQDLIKLEKMAGEKESVTPFIDTIIESNIVLIHEKIVAGFPTSSIFFENTTDFIPEDADGSKFMVIPLGGVKNLSHGYEEAFVAMAYIDKNGRTQDAVVYNPFNEECFYASNNNGAFSLHSRLRCSNRKESCDIVSFLNKDNTSSEDFDKVTKLTIEELKANNPLKISDASLLDMILVSAGKKDAFIATGLSMQEVLITELFAKESGSILTDFKSKLVDENTNSIIMANSKLHAKILQRI